MEVGPDTLGTCPDPRHPAAMARVIPCALAYAAAIFALGFALGAVRVLAVAPRTGALAAVALELPLMLTASAWLARRLVRRAALTRGQAWAMGLLAFALLLAAERALASLFGQSGADWLAGLLTPAGLLGLAGQVGFGVMPGVFGPGTESVSRGGAEARR